MDSRAASKLTCRDSGEPITVFESMPRNGSSKSPNWYFTVRILRAASSMRLAGTFPSCASSSKRSLKL